MMRSMFSGVSGLSTHQLKMDTIGNNIANVNTVGFKAGRVTFKEVYSQTIKGASSPQEGRGGTNPHQVGLGVGVSSMDTLHIKGPVERTDNPTDLAIDGDGFFIVSNDANFLNRSYTRAGDFALDSSGNLITGSTGYRVLGYMVDERTGEYKPSLEGIVISKASQVDAQATTKGAIEGNLNANLSLNNSFSHTFSTFDGLGGMHEVKLNFEKTGPNAWSVTADLILPSGPQAFGGGPVNLAFGEIMSNGKAFQGRLIQIGGTEIYSNTDTNDWVLNPNASAIRFGIGGDGGTISGSGTNPLTNGAPPFEFGIDLSKITQFVSESSLSNDNFDGYPKGTLDNFQISQSGEIFGIFDNGQSRVLGRVGLANFKNPAGLIKTNNNMYQVSPNAGQPIYGIPGTSGLGLLSPGALEMSNVDLSREFTEMIRTQRGFQANSRIISTSDEMLQELVNLKR